VWPTSWVWRLRSASRPGSKERGLANKGTIHAYPPTCHRCAAGGWLAVERLQRLPQRLQHQLGGALLPARSGDRRGLRARGGAVPELPPALSGIENKDQRPDRHQQRVLLVAIRSCHFVAWRRLQVKRGPISLPDRDGVPTPRGPSDGQDLPGPESKIYDLLQLPIARMDCRRILPMPRCRPGMVSAGDLAGKDPALPRPIKGCRTPS